MYKKKSAKIALAVCRDKAGKIHKKAPAKSGGRRHMIDQPNAEIRDNPNTIERMTMIIAMMSERSSMHQNDLA